MAISLDFYSQNKVTKGSDTTTNQFTVDNYSTLNTNGFDDIWRSEAYYSMRIIIGLDGDVDGYLVSKNAHLSYWTCTGKSQHKHFINLQRNEISMFDVKLYFSQPIRSL